VSLRGGTDALVFQREQRTEWSTVGYAHIHRVSTIQLFEKGTKISKKIVKPKSGQAMGRKSKGVSVG